MPIEASQAEAGTGLQYLQQRYYDPAVGRFLSQDPLRSVNQYVYVHNDPANQTDPSGEGSFGRFLIGVAACAVVSLSPAANTPQAVKDLAKCVIDYEKRRKKQEEIAEQAVKLTRAQLTEEK